MDIKKLEKLLIELDLPKYRLEQIKKAVYQEGILDFSKMTNLPKNLREKLSDEIKIMSLEPVKVIVSRDRKSIKAVLNTWDNKKIETVIMSVKSGFWTACLSVQIGCALNCAFCATGGMGLKRNLNSEEIEDQVLFWQNYLKENKINGILTNLVYMGMGEPFMNWENLKTSINDLMCPDLFNFGARSISVSTVGIIEGINKFAKEFPQVNLAISLHSADNKKREELIPISKHNNLNQIKRALENYIDKTNRKLFIEYIMIKNVNDGSEDMKILTNYIRSFAKSYLLHVNLITYNETNLGFVATSLERIKECENYLKKNKISVTIRKSLGADIQGACGQLSGK
jgi:23S rRNA (adenine2503-C2)-methyltransferase